MARKRTQKAPRYVKADKDLVMGTFHPEMLEKMGRLRKDLTAAKRRVNDLSKASEALAEAKGKDWRDADWFADAVAEAEKAGDGTTAKRLGRMADLLRQVDEAQKAADAYRSEYDATVDAMLTEVTESGKSVTEFCETRGQDDSEDSRPDEGVASSEGDETAKGDAGAEQKPEGSGDAPADETPSTPADATDDLTDGDTDGAVNPDDRKGEPASGEDVTEAPSTNETVEDTPDDGNASDESTQPGASSHESGQDEVDGEGPDESEGAVTDGSGHAVMTDDLRAFVKEHGQSPVGSGGDDGTAEAPGADDDESVQDVEQDAATGSEEDHDGTDVPEGEAPEANDGADDTGVLRAPVADADKDDEEAPSPAVGEAAPSDGPEDGHDPFDTPLDEPDEGNPSKDSDRARAIDTMTPDPEVNPIVDHSGGKFPAYVMVDENGWFHVEPYASKFGRKKRVVSFNAFRKAMAWAFGSDALR